MSCLTLFPYGHTLEYWWEELRGEPNRIRFLITKAVELHAFRHNFRRNRTLPRPAGSPVFCYRRGDNGISPQAKVAVVVPVYVRNPAQVAMLKELCIALQRQTRTHKVIIIDDASPIPLLFPNQVAVCRQTDNRGPAAARNRGIAMALAEGMEVIALTDLDCRPSPIWLDSFVEAFIEAPDVHLLSGNTQSYDGGWLGRYHDRNGTLNGRQIKGSDALLYGPTCNLAGCAAVFSELRFDEGFPNAAAEDIEFCYRANLNGYRIGHCRTAVVEHDFGYRGMPFHRALQHFWRQFRRYADGEPLLMDRHPDYLSAFVNSIEISVDRGGHFPGASPGRLDDRGGRSLKGVIAGGRVVGD